MKSIMGSLAPPLKEYCLKNGLSFEKVKKSPMCGDGDTRLYIQHVDFSSSMDFIDDSEPAEILISVYRTKESGAVLINEGKNAKKYLSA